MRSLIIPTIAKCCTVCQIEQINTILNVYWCFDIRFPRFCSRLQIKYLTETIGGRICKQTKIKYSVYSKPDTSILPF